MHLCMLSLGGNFRTTTQCSGLAKIEAEVRCVYSKGQVQLEGKATLKSNSSVTLQLDGEKSILNMHDGTVWRCFIGKSGDLLLQL